MPQKTERKKSSWQSGNVKDTKSDRPKLGMFAGAANESPDKPRTGRKCPIHELSNHALQDCPKFTSMSVVRKKRLFLETDCVCPVYMSQVESMSSECKISSGRLRNASSHICP
jgi:hypothetical protein